MNKKTKVNQKKDSKKGQSSGLIVMFLLLLLGLAVGGCYYFYREFFTSKSSGITVVSKMDDYSYYLNSNTTRLYKKYYKLLEKELSDSKVDEREYVSLLAQLFTIDFYTLNNKLTNRDIGGIQFVASSLQERFKEEASNTVYKYVRNNTNQRRNQRLPEVNKSTVLKVSNSEYTKGDFSDSSGFIVTVELEYVEDLDYPTKLKLFFVHEENKLVLVEITEES